MERFKDLILITADLAPAPLVSLLINGVKIDEQRTVAFYNFKKDDIIDAVRQQIG